MNALTSSLVPAIGWSLIDFLWQGALIALAAAIALMVLRNARPQARYTVCCAALALCLALPVGGVLRALASTSDADGSMAARFVTFAPTDAARTVAAPAASWQSSLQNAMPWIVVAWSIGAALLAARMALGMMWVAQAGREHADPHPRWQRRLDRLAEKIGVECRVRLRVVAELASPVAAGCWKPVVLVPAALVTALPLDLVEALLAHELAHVRRHDYLVNLIQSAIEALLFYHPVVWWLSRRIRIEREQIADDIAAAAIGEPRRLALALHELDLFQDALRRSDARDGYLTTTLMPAANGGHLMSRIQRLVRPNQHALSWKMALPIIGLTAVCLTVHANNAAPAPGEPASPAQSPVPVVAGEAAMNSAAAQVAIAGRPASLSASVRAAIAGEPALLAKARQAAIAGRAALASDPMVVAAVAAGRPVLADARKIRSPGGGEAYALVREGHDGMTMSGDIRDIPLIEGTRKKVHGDFLWVRHDGRTYVVQDPTLLARAVEAWKVTEPIEKEMHALEERMKVPEQRMEALSRQMEALDNDKSPAHIAMERYQAQMDTLDRQIEAISSKIEAVGDKMEDANRQQRETLQREMGTLQSKMAPLTAQMQKLAADMEQQGKQLEAQMKPLEQLGKQMEAESKPMEALGKQMEELGKQEEALSREAERKMHAIIDEAVRNGTATPTENTRQ